MADISHISTPSSGWRVLDLPEDGNSHGGSLLSTISSNGLDPKLDALRRGLIAKDDTERVTRDLSKALARSIATISRSNSREGSPVKSRSREPSPKQEHGHVRGAGSATLAAYAREGVNGDSINTSHHDPEMERSESVIRSLQEQAKRRLNGLERLHASAESNDSGPTLYNPAAYQPRGAALSAKVNNLQGLSRPKSAPKLASKTAVKKSSKKSPPLAIWRHELEMLESDLNLLASHQDQLHRERQRKMQAWEANLCERERAIEAFQTKEFIDFALSSAQTAQQISNKEEELRAEEEMLNHEKHIVMENVQELQKIRSQLETQRRNMENGSRLDVPDDLREPRLDAKAEQLRVWEVNLLSREHAVDRREVDVARKHMDLQERERNLQVKHMTMQELKNQIYNEFAAWEDELMRKEKATAGNAQGRDDSRTAFEPLSLYSGAFPYRQSAAWEMHCGRDNELQRPGLSPLDHNKDHSILDAKWPRHLSRKREHEALNRSLQRGKENSLLGVNFA